MVYLFFGEDTFQSRERLHGFLKEIKEDNPLSLSWLSPDIFARPAFEELCRTENLFGGRYIVVCEDFFQEKEIADFCVENLGLCAGSGNIFIFWEEDLDSVIVKNFKKHAEKIEEFKFLPLRELKIWLRQEAEKRKISLSPVFEENLIKESGHNLWLLSQELEKYTLSSKKDFQTTKKVKEENIFHLTDAVAAKDKSQAWFLFQKMLMAGVDSEEIFWKIVWQIKNLLLLKKLGPASPNRGEPLPERKIVEMTKLHPYVVKKTLSACRNYSEKELAGYSSELIDLYHKARRGKADFDVGVEKFLIKL